jgi:predicted nucleic acid-binding protein
MKKQKLYLDTSIPSAYYDTSKPIRQLVTQKWFENETKNYKLYTSNIAFQEIQNLKNIEKKTNIENILFGYNVELLEMNEEAFKLAEIYMEKGAIPNSEPEDAYHVAIASINNIDALASWNFKHIVSLNPIKKIHEINQKNGYKIIEISSLELFGGARYGNI